MERLGVAVAVIVAGLLGGIAGAGCDARAAGGGSRAVLYVGFTAAGAECHEAGGAVKPECCPDGFTAIGTTYDNNVVCLED